MGAMPCVGHHRVVGAATAEQAAMNLGMKRFDTPIHDFRKAGVARDFFYRDARLRQQLRGAAGGQNLDVAFRELTRQLHDAVLYRKRK